MFGCKACKALKEQNEYLQKLLDKIIEAHGVAPVNPDERVGRVLEKDIIESEHTGTTLETYGD